MIVEANAESKFLLPVPPIIVAASSSRRARSPARSHVSSRRVEARRTRHLWRLRVEPDVNKLCEACGVIRGRVSEPTSLPGSHGESRGGRRRASHRCAIRHPTPVSRPAPLCFSLLCMCVLIYRAWGGGGGVGWRGWLAGGVVVCPCGWRAEQASRGRRGAAPPVGASSAVPHPWWCPVATVHLTGVGGVADRRR